METPLALYIHWPFCVSKCPYCDFNSHMRESIDVEQWRTALFADMAHEATLTQERRLGSIFFGGGTPSLMPPALAGDLIAAAERLWGLADDVEITLEANPNSAEAARFADLASAGVNRVSLGIQSFEPEVLHFLGRAHDADEARTALHDAQNIFARVSFDLIYALPNQTARHWEDQLAYALSLGTGHLSLYQLTIEPGTRFETMVRRGDFTPADDEEAANLYELTQAMTEAAGLPAYEISNHARPGEESRHNLAYWRYRDYAGIGPGAHGRRGNSCGHKMATQRHRKPENWMEAVRRNGHGCQSETPLSIQQQGREALMMGLRLKEGVDLADLARRTGADRHALIDADPSNTLSGHGLLDVKGDRLRVTPQGMLLLDAILPQIVL